MKRMDYFMLEILYRIYQVPEPKETHQTAEENEDCCDLYNSISKLQNIELCMDCLICDTREQFKNIIKDTYGQDIKFAYSKKMSPGQFYCIIIGEHCFNAEQYFNRLEYNCDYCGVNVVTYFKPYTIPSWEIKTSLFNNFAEYEHKKFCCSRCKYKFVEREQKRLRPSDEQEFFVTRDMFTGEVAGYIYKITKKSTGEFYIGQTVYAPIFRWGQHLKTERFDIKDITDYQFETIEIVPLGENILEREKYYIQKGYQEQPDKILNIQRG